MATLAEIQAQIDALQKQADEIKKAEINQVLVEIKAKISAYGLTAEQLGFSGSDKKAKGKKVVKYRKDNLTWSGSARGRKPEWVQEVLNAGGDIEQYRVE